MNNIRRHFYLRSLAIAILLVTMLIIGYAFLFVSNFQTQSSWHTSPDKNQLFMLKVTTKRLEKPYAQ